MLFTFYDLWSELVYILLRHIRLPISQTEDFLDMMKMTTSSREEENCLENVQKFNFAPWMLSQG